MRSKSMNYLGPIVYLFFLSSLLLVEESFEEYCYGLRKEAPSCKTKTKDEPSDSLKFISKEDSMPVIVEKPKSYIEDNSNLLKNFLLSQSAIFEWFLD